MLKDTRANENGSALDFKLGDITAPFDRLHEDFSGWLEEILDMPGAAVRAKAVQAIQMDLAHVQRRLLERMAKLQTIAWRVSRDQMVVEMRCMAGLGHLQLVEGECDTVSQTVGNSLKNSKP